MKSRSLAALSTVLLAGLGTVALGCRPTVDYLGYDRVDALAPLVCPAPYRSAYRDVLRKTDAEIDRKLRLGFEQLFHGAAGDQAIYFESGTDQASIRDILHAGDVRTEGMALGMLSCVLLDRREEFERLWRYSVAELANKTGTLAGHFGSYCDSVQIPVVGTPSASRSCNDPYGLEQYVMALLLARQRWGSSAGSIDFAAEATRLFAVMRGKGASSSTASSGAAGDASTAGGTSSTPAAVVTTFDAETKLVYDEPALSPLRQTGTSLLMPGYFTLWAQVTGDSFYAEAAAAARLFLRKVAHPQTGLVPVRATFEAVPVENWGNFSAEAYRVFLNLVIDRLWATSDPWQGPQIEALVGFFSRAGIDSYSAAYSLDGTVTLIRERPDELVLANAVIASLSNNDVQKVFLQRAWDVEIPTGENRYYRGLFYLMSNLILGGRFQACP